ncbi:MAG: LacI family DNA-binding transcriptional regulator [Collinsella sp.]|nr:LacI family DNA-binding transcriptional regulator [Collinsella sp.]
MEKVTIQDVAREAGVSLGTASNALNHPEKLKASTLQKVQSAMSTLGYMPNQSARLLAGGRNASFGLLLPSLDHGLFLQIANGAHSEARRHGFGLLIASADDDEQLQRSYLRYFMGTQMAGVLIQPLRIHDAPLDADFPIPIVYLDLHCRQPGYFVAVDNRAQGRLIAEHAVSIGSRRVSVIGSCEGPQAEHRVRGIRDVEATNPSVDFDYLLEGSTGLARDGFMMAQRIAELPETERPDFIIALSDVLATGAIAGAQDAGLRVPDDIAIAGCDGNPLAWNDSVPLTTCAPTGYEMGRRGVQFLVEQIGDGAGRERNPPVEEDPCHQTLIRPFLLARRSTVRG